MWATAAESRERGRGALPAGLELRGRDDRAAAAGRPWRVPWRQPASAGRDAAPGPRARHRRDPPARRPCRHRPGARRRGRRPARGQQQPARRRPGVVGELPQPARERREGPPCRRLISADGEFGRQPGVVVGDGAAVGEQLAVVVEEDDAVAQQAPTLLGVAADHGGEVTGLAGGVGAGRYVVAHRDHIRSAPGAVPGVTLPCSSDYRIRQVCASAEAGDA